MGDHEPTNTHACECRPRQGLRRAPKRDKNHADLGILRDLTARLPASSRVSDGGSLKRQAAAACAVAHHHPRTPRTTSSMRDGGNAISCSLAEATRLRALLIIVESFPDRRLAASSNPANAGDKALLEELMSSAIRRSHGFQSNVRRASSGTPAPAWVRATWR